MNQTQHANEILEGRFIKRVFTESAKEIDKAVSKVISTRGFENTDWNDRSFQTSDSALQYTHLKKFRFVDMKTRSTKTGKKRKKSYPLHNKIIWGNYSNIVRELSVGFTEGVKEQLRTIED